MEKKDRGFSGILIVQKNNLRAITKVRPIVGRIPKKRVIINLGLRKINLERKSQNKFGTKIAK